MTVLQPSPDTNDLFTLFGLTMSQLLLIGNKYLIFNFKFGPKLTIWDYKLWGGSSVSLLCSFSKSPRYMIGLVSKVWRPS